MWRADAVRLACPSDETTELSAPRRAARLNVYSACLRTNRLPAQVR